MCGVPGSGKTTFAKEIARGENVVRYSYDELPGAFEPQQVEAVYQKMYEDIASDLRAGRDVVADSLFIHKKRRVELLTSIQEIECYKILIVMSTPLEECLRRNTTRTGRARVPDFVIRGLAENYEESTLNEGWDEILYF